jgi:hypothetical protein
MYITIFFYNKMNKTMKRLHVTFLYLLLGFTGIVYLFGCNSHQTDKKLSAVSPTVVENSSLQLPKGFTAVIVADSVGKASHYIRF